MRRPLLTGERLVVIAGVGAAIGLVIIPLVKLGQIALEQGGSSVARVLHAPGLGTAAMHTMMLACVVPLFAVPLGCAMAIFLRRADVPCRGLLRVLVLLPLVIPQFVLGYSWTQSYGRAGFTDGLVGLRWNALNGPVGITAVLVVDAAPLCYLLTTVGLATRAQPDLERAAHLCGASAWTTLRTVTLPLLRPILAAEVVLTFIATAESFAVPQVLGAPSGFATLTTRIYSDLALASDPDSFLDAVTLSLSLVLVAAVVLLPADIVLGPKLRAVRTAQPGGAVHALGRNWRTLAAALVLGIYTVFAVGLPTMALVAAAITRAIGLPPTPSNWTLGNFRAAMDPTTIDALWNSVQLATVAAFALTGFGALIAALERHRAGRALGTLAILTFAIPGSALAVGLLIAYGRWFGGSIALIFVAYLAKFWALAHRTLSGAVERLPHGEWQAARVSGAGPGVAVRTIWLPSLAPALLGAWALIFVSALHEVTMSSLLYSFGNQTLAVAVLNRQELGDLGTTAALSVLLSALLLVAVIPILVSLRLINTRRAGRRAAPDSPSSPPRRGPAVVGGG